MYSIYIYICYIYGPQTEICLSQKRISLSQTQLRQLACPKSTRIVTNGVPVAPFELKLGQNDSYGLQEPFKTPPGPPRAHFRPKIPPHLVRG